MKFDSKKSFYPENKNQWRNWLIKNQDKEDFVWLIFYKVKSPKKSITWSEAVDEALCFGWIDSVKKTLNEESYVQYFSKRKPKSSWSKINKLKIEELTKRKLMTKSGSAVIEIAKQNGSWSMLDDVENLIVPEELQTAFRSNKKAAAYYDSLSNSGKKILLGWIAFAKRSETKEKRIVEIIRCAELGELPKQFR
jgi:uncharacterized protein YdeI (YjbR/CyaY-like superfamily)